MTMMTLATLLFCSAVPDMRTDAVEVDARGMIHPVVSGLTPASDDSLLSGVSWADLEELGMGRPPHGKTLANIVEKTLSAQYKPNEHEPRGLPVPTAKSQAPRYLQPGDWRDPSAALHYVLPHAPTMFVVAVLLVLTVLLHAWLSKGGAVEFRANAAACCAAYVAYVGLSLLFQSIMRLSSRAGVSHIRALDVVGACLVIKIAMASVMYGKEVEWSGRRAAEEAKAAKTTLIKCAVPGVCYVLADFLRAYCLLGMDMSSYTAVFANRTVAVAVLWVVIFKTTLSQTKWLCLALLSFGTCVVHLGESGTPNMPLDRHFYAAVASVFVACLASVFNELLLKTEPVGINLQNLAVYSIGLAFLMTMARLSGEHVSPLQWFSNGPLSMAGIIVLSVFGIVTSFFLKLLNNLWKEVAIACQVVVSFALETILFGTEYTVMSIIGVMIVFLGMSGFALDGMQAETKNVSSSARDMRAEALVEEESDEPAH